MHRLFVPYPDLSAEVAALSRDNLNHLKVIRPKDGEEIELFDGEGRMRRFVWDGRKKELVAKGEIKVVEDALRKYATTLFACVTKGARWDWTLEKATELGIGRIVPVISERTIVRISAGEMEAKRERWQRIAIEAARQSDALWLPQIVAAVSFDEAVEMARQTHCFVGALIPEKPKTLLEALRMTPRGELGHSSVFIGPEGDFTPGEMEQLLKFAEPVNLGPTILRAETAAIYAVSVLKAFLISE